MNSALLWLPIFPEFILTIKFRYTGCTMGFDKIHLKEATFTWPGIIPVVCIRFENLTLSNQKSYSDFLFEKPVTCFVLMIWQISIVRRFEDLTKSDRFWLEFVKSSKRRTKKSSRENIWINILIYIFNLLQDIFSDTANEKFFTFYDQLTSFSTQYSTAKMPMRKFQN